MGRSAHLFADPSDDPVLIEDARELAAIGELEFLRDVGKASETLVPNRPMPIEDWAPVHAFIPASKSTRGGPARLTPVQRGLARLLQDIETDVLLNLKCPRLGITTFGSFCAGYYAGWEQSDVLIYERSKPTAQVYAKDQLMPIFRASTTLKALLRPDSKTGEQDTWDNRELTTGAKIKIRSIENEDSFKGIRGKLIVCEEAGDGGWQSGGANSREGSKLDLAMRRGQEFANGKVFLSGTPTIKGKCLISAQWDVSRQHLYRMPCPHCGHLQEFVPDVRPAPDPTLRYGAGLRYTKNARGIPDDCWYECANLECSAPNGRIDEIHKSSMMELGGFDLVREGEPRKVGTFIWMAYSEDPKATWLDIAKEAEKGLFNGNEESKKAFVTMFLAQPYDAEPPIAVDSTVLMERMVDLGDGIDCPADTVFLVASCDNQKGRGKDDPDHPARGEVKVLAVRENGRAHVVRHDWLHARTDVTGFGEEVTTTYEPFDVDYVDAFYEILDRDYVTADGRKLRPRATFVDCGWQTELAWRFCTSPASKARKIVPIRGDTTERANRRVPLLPGKGQLRRSQKSGRSYVWVGTTDAKDEMARRLAIPDPAPYSITFSTGLDERYFRGLLAERQITEKNGLKRWVSVSADETGEPWDCLLYAYAAAEYVMIKNRRLREQVYRIDPALIVATQKAQETDSPVEPLSDPAPPEVGTEISVPVVVQPPPEAPAEHVDLRTRLLERKAAGKPADKERDKGFEERMERIRKRKGRSGVGW